MIDNSCNSAIGPIGHTKSTSISNRTEGRIFNTIYYYLGTAGRITSLSNTRSYKTAYLQSLSYLTQDRTKQHHFLMIDKQLGKIDYFLKEHLLCLMKNTKVLKIAYIPLGRAYISL